MRGWITILAFVSIQAFAKATVTLKMVPEKPKVSVTDTVVFPGGPDEFVAIGPWFTVDANITNAGKKNVYLTGLAFYLKVGQSTETWYYGSADPILVKPKKAHSFNKIYIEALPVQSSTVYDLKVEVMGMENSNSTEDVILEANLKTE